MMAQSEDEIVTLVRQRRKWSRGEKERIVAAAMVPGAVASAVARKAGIQASQLFRWRRQLHGAQRFASLTLNQKSPIRNFSNASSTPNLSRPNTNRRLHSKRDMQLERKNCSSLATSPSLRTSSIGI